MTTLAAIALALILGTTGVAREESATPKPPADPIFKELEQVRKMLTNAQAKMNRGAVGVDTGQTGEASTPGRRCCSGNLQHIDAGIKKIRGLVRERGICFERRRDRESMEVVNLVNQDLRSLTSAVELFADSTDPVDTQRGLAGCTRAYLNLKRSTEALKDCDAGQ